MLIAHICLYIVTDNLKLQPSSKSFPHFFAGLLGPSTAFSNIPAIPSLLASNWLPITPSLENGPPIFSPIWPMLPSARESLGIHCENLPKAEELEYVSAE